jgi:F-type H+-transporting ATPase subunit b
MKNTVSRFPSSVSRFLMLTLVAFVALGVVQAQEHKAVPQAPQKQEEKKSGSQQQPGINEQFGQPLAAESSEAAGTQAKENDQEKMVLELKQSPSVRWMATHLHISPMAGYWVGYILDFGILALLIVLALKKNLPAAFRSRTATIQRGIEEAHKARGEANQRLAEIEARLAKLDDEVAAMRVASEQETAAEEQRILNAADEDRRRIVEAAESEIAAAAKQARHELKAFTADLAVSLAERRMHIDSETDAALVRSFTEQLANPAGKDGQQ